LRASISCAFFGLEVTSAGNDGIAGMIHSRHHVFLCYIAHAHDGRNELSCVTQKPNASLMLI